MVTTYKGISFPFRISSASGGVQVASYIDDKDYSLIRQSIIQIIGTSIGERVREKYFGTEGYKSLFEPNDDATMGLLVQSIIQSISAYEPRVTIIDIKSAQDQDNGELMIGVAYKINRTGQTDQFAFSF